MTEWVDFWIAFVLFVAVAIFSGFAGFVIGYYLLGMFGGVVGGIIVESAALSYVLN